MFENHPKINDDNNLIPDKTIVIVPEIGISKERISEVIKPLKGNKKRDWFAEVSYFCLPLVIANQYGFVIESTDDIEIKKRKNSTMLEINNKTNEGLLKVGNSPQPNAFNFKLPFVLRTPPMVNLMVITPPNFILPAGLTVLNGVVEADNLQFDFSLNYIVEEPTTINIKKGMPIAGIIPIPRNYADEFSLKFADELFDTKVINFEQLTHSNAEHVRNSYDRYHFAETGQRRRNYFKGIDTWGNPFRFPHQKG